MFSFSPQHRSTQPSSLSLFPHQGPSELSGWLWQSAGSALTWSPHSAGPEALLSPALFLAPSPRPPQEARPNQGQAVLEKCWEVAECAVCEFPPNWRPSPWANSGRVSLSTAACVLLPGQEIPRAGSRVGDVTDPLGLRGRGKDRLGDDKPATCPAGPSHPLAGRSDQGQPKDHASFTSAATQDIPLGEMEFTL